MKKGLQLRAMTLCAMMTATAVVLVSLGMLLPQTGLSLAAAAGLCPQISLWAGGRRAAVMTYGASGLLCLILGLSAESTLCYLILFGFYPTAKSLLEQIKSRGLAWVCKIVYANLVLALLMGLSILFFPDILAIDQTLWLIWLAFQGIFIFYDILLSKAPLLLQRYVNITDRR